MNEQKGCLLFLLEAFKKKSTEEKTLPYEEKKLLSAAELSFYRILQECINGEYEILCKIKLDDLIQVKKNTEAWQAHKNKINRKHIDFGLFHPKTMKLVCAIELDDASHEKEDRQERDSFVDDAFKATGLKILHVKCQKAYNTNEILDKIRPMLQQ